APIVMPEDEIPSVSGRLLSSAEEIEALQIPSLSAGRVPQYLMANMLSARNITDRPVFAGCIGPFSLAGRLYDMNEIMMGIYIEPDAMHLLLDKCTTFIINYCQAIKKTGVAGVMMAEPASGLLSDEDAMQFSTQYVKRVVDAVQDDNFTLVLHNCGNTGHCTNSMIASGARALHFGNMIDMEQVMSEVPSSILVMGNLDPVSIFKQATPEKVFEETSALLEKMKPYNNFVISSGCDLPPEVPFANIDAFFQALNKH
ncbi:MAG: uroporphyrinogen decarboxylase family protein, partial [Bacteroidales bacterium]|nr:uroporphyrinogen decarboxylase family protein [Bacteroidales bacterium]